MCTSRSTTCLPPQTVMLTVTSNKMQPIDPICKDIVSHKVDFNQHKLVLTGSDPVPVEIIRRHDVKTGGSGYY